ncbi:Segregation and condensation protein A [Chlamydiales bacterium SCGC AG-110-M15]|nr:Segregation and condensation protein A [Chlamydiales bacterium SCGC AG-110-M15]
MAETTAAEKAFSFALQNFSGPLDLLLFLIQKKELDIYDVQIQNITTQYSDHLSSLAGLSVDDGAEFLSSTALLMYIKSQTLLPRPPSNDEDLIPEDPLSILPRLIEYYKFKGLAKDLSNLEVRENVHYPRAVPKGASRKFFSMGIDHLSIDDLQEFFQGAMERAASRKKEILDDEVWTVSDKMDWIRDYLLENTDIPLTIVFNEDCCRDELIVSFLAVLELMKTGEISLVRDRASRQMLLTRKIEVPDYDGNGNQPT